MSGPESTHICVALENNLNKLQCQNLFFFMQKSTFFGKSSTFTQTVSMRAVLKICVQDKRLLF